MESREQIIAETRIVAMAKFVLFVTLTETDIYKVSAHKDLSKDLHVPPPQPTTLCMNQCTDKKAINMMESSQGEASTIVA
jgi:hypothetical protein